MKGIIAGLLAITLQTAFCQPSDSARLYHVPKWKLDVLLDAYAYDLPSCLSTVNKYSIASDSLKQAINAAMVLIDLRTQERDLKVKEAKDLDLLLKNNEAQQKVDLKLGKAKARKTGFLLGIGVLVIVEAFRLVSP